MHVAHPRIVYRVMWCEQCSSLRYHSITHLCIKHTLFNGVWVRFRKRCSGVAPVMSSRLPRLVRDCGLTAEAWLEANRWNALIEERVYDEVA